MDSSKKKKVTITSEPWNIDHVSIETNGFAQSPIFGTESTQFYLRSQKSLQTSIYTLHLILSFCQEDSILVKGTFMYGYTELKHNYPVNGKVSLDKINKLGSDAFWTANSQNSFCVSVELTFEEIERKTPTISQLQHYELLSSALQKLRLFSTNSADITLVTTLDDRQFPAHKIILSARSSVFEAMFGNADFSENQNRLVKIDDVNGTVMDALLDYLYTANIGKINETAGDLLLAADKYDIPPLVQACMESMVTSLSVENAAKFFYLADLHQMDDFKGQIIHFISKNQQAVRNSSGWKEYIGIQQMQQLYDAFLLK